MHISRLEFVARHVEHHLVGETLLDGDADGLRQVRLAQTRTAEDEERVEDRLAGGGGDVLAGRHTHLVALALHEVGEAIHGIEPRVDLDLMQAGIDERAGVRGRSGRDGDLRIDRCGGALPGETHLGLVAHRTYHIGKLCVLAHHTLERLAQHIEESGLDIFLEEERGHLDGELGIRESHRPDRAEPHLELLRLNDLLDDVQTVVPYFDVSLL